MRLFILNFILTAVVVAMPTLLGQGNSGTDIERRDGTTRFDPGFAFKHKRDGTTEFDPVFAL
ncbi:hypothetical protein F5Y16DRAFT_397850 [Xylariaceae sp. FL0255]|nr:hypothetical protein F5Y16DRAFT_397850 [Xylariaceae sp. FL0255]